MNASLALHVLFSCLLIDDMSVLCSPAVEGVSRERHVRQLFYEPNADDSRAFDASFVCHKTGVDDMKGPNMEDCLPREL